MLRPPVLLMPLVALVLLLNPLLGRAAGQPPIFDRRPYEQAKRAAEQSGKWLIVKGTAVWCGPCKQMDNTTWRNDRVEAWLKQRAIVVAVDVDKEKRTAQQLRISAMPTMIAFKGGKEEVARVVGYRGPDEFLKWLHELEPGDARPAVREKGGDAVSRLERARELMATGDDQGAAEEYGWVWENKASLPASQAAAIAGAMAALAERNTEAKARFTTLRNKITAKVDKGGDRDAAHDWLVLNRIIGDKEQSLAWFTTVKEQETWRPHLQSLAGELEGLLAEQGRWAEMSLLYTDPLGLLAREHAALKSAVRAGPPKELAGQERREYVEKLFASFFERAGWRYAALLAGDREEDASEFASMARQLEPKPAVVREMLAFGLKAGEAREEHLAWVQKIKGRDRAAAGLEAELKKALGK